MRACKPLASPPLPQRNWYHSFRDNAANFYRIVRTQRKKYAETLRTKEIQCDGNRNNVSLDLKSTLDVVSQSDRLHRDSELRIQIWTMQFEIQR